MHSERPHIPGNIGLAVDLHEAEEPHPDQDKFLRSIGRLVFFWGQVENLLRILQQIAINVARRHGIEEKPQISLSGKLRLIKRIYKNTPALAADIKHVRPALRLIAQLGRQRHDFIHSAMEGISPTDPPRLIMRRNKLVAGQSSTKVLQPTLAEINALVGQIFGEGTTSLLGLIAILIPHQEGDDTSHFGPLLKILKADPGAPTS